MGDELTEILECIESGNKYNKKKAKKLEIGVDCLPQLSADTTDRNRTSPFAFTGNKFEFRMLGSAFSISCTNVMINTTVAEALDQFATELEKAEDFTDALNKLIKRTIKEHKRIIFNGNNYSEEWVIEAEKRGLLNLKSTAEALPLYATEKNIRMFEKYRIYTSAEVHSRQEILLENYCKTLNIEALTMIEMSNRDILPAVTAYLADLSQTAAQKKKISPDLTVELEEKLIQKLSLLQLSLYHRTEALSTALLGAKETDDAATQATYFRNRVFPAMQELRAVADELETIVGRKYWPFPTYGDLLFSI